MLSFLFPRLTPAPSRGAALFEALVAQARRPRWYDEGQVPDTLDGRFSVLATITALTIVRLERGGEAGRAATVAVTERFVEAMDAEHRQLGISDPKLGKTVRKLVAALGRRVELWRETVASADGWDRAAAASLFHGQAPESPALGICDQELRAYWRRLEAATDEDLAEGRIG